MTPTILSPLAPASAHGAPTHRLVLLNDAETAYAFAVAALESVFAVPRLAAERAVQHAHEHGRSPLAEGTLVGLTPALDLLARLAAHTGQTLRVVVEAVPVNEVSFAAEGFAPVLSMEKI